MNVDELWKKVQQGDLSSFDSLYGIFFSGLCQYAFQLLNDRFLAEETVQDILLKLWEDREHVFSQGASLKNYLYLITHNRCRNILKKNSSEKAGIIKLFPFDTWAMISEKYGFDEYLIEKIETEETAALIDGIVEQLPAQRREIFRLSRDEEKSNAEIAQQMGLSESTVRVQLYRATQKIKEELLPLL
jgi:RNA polymerase sigma-70 factor (ECF subfamily)